jgi:hypothetical protein
MSALDQTTFAAAKLNFMLSVSLDAELSKIAQRVAGIFIGRYMHADNGGEAWPAIKTLCEDLGVKSESKVRDGLYALQNRGHLMADRRAGATTRYRIADRYFERAAPPQYGAATQPLYGAGSKDTQPLYGAGGPPPIGAEGPPPIGATNTGNITPVNEPREFSPQPPRGREGEDLPSGKAQASTSGEKPDAFGCFEAVWQWGRGESLRAARAAFHRLSESDRESAIRGAAAFQSAMAGRQHPPHASTYLSERKWVFVTPSPPRRMKALRGGVGALLADHYARPTDTFKNGVGVMLAESYFGIAAAHGADEKIIDLEAVRLEPAKPAGALSVLPLERDRRVVLHPGSEQLAAWHAYERRMHGRAQLGLTRPAEWPPGVEIAARADGSAARAAAIGR